MKNLLNRREPMMALRFTELIKPWGVSGGEPAALDSTRIAAALRALAPGGDVTAHPAGEAGLGDALRLDFAGDLLCFGDNAPARDFAFGGSHDPAWPAEATEAKPNLMMTGPGQDGFKKLPRHGAATVRGSMRVGRVTARVERGKQLQDGRDFVSRGGRTHGNQPMFAARGHALISYVP